MKKLLLFVLLVILVIPLTACSEKEVEPVSQINENPVKVDELIQTEVEVSEEATSIETLDVSVQNNLKLPEKEYSVTYYRDFVFDDGSVKEAVVSISIIGYNYYTAEEMTESTKINWVFHETETAGVFKLKATIKFDEDVNAYNISIAEKFPKFDFIGLMPGGPGYDVTDVSGDYPNSIHSIFKSLISEEGEGSNILTFEGIYYGIRQKQGEGTFGISIYPDGVLEEEVFLELPAYK